MHKTITDYIRSYCKISNIHGVHYLASKRSKTERIVWVFFLTISISCCMYMISKIWEKYQKNPIVISFGTKDLSIHEVPFPAITICPETKCASSVFNYSDIFYKILENKTVDDEDFRKFSYMYMLCDLEDFLDLNGDQTMDEDFFAILEEVKPNVTIVCSFLQKSCNDYIIPIVTDSGLCYSFNILRKEDIFRDDVLFPYDSKDLNISDFEIDSRYGNNINLTTYPFRAHMGGIDDALAFQFLIGNTEADTDAVCNSMFQGFTILVHSPLELPQSSLYYANNVPSNKLVVVKVEPDVMTTSEEIKIFDADKRKCYFSHERPLKYFKFYTQPNCFLECLANFTLNRCNCVPYFLPRKKNVQICGIGSNQCFEDAENDMIIDEKTNRILNKKTTCDCQPSCNDLKYKAQSVLTDANIENYLKRKYARTPDAYDIDNVSISAALISFKSNQFLPVERKELFGIFDLISNFGGLLGLFLGFSLISFMEIIYFFTWRLFFNKKLHGDWTGKGARK